MDSWLLLAVLLYLACAALIVAEVFIPSAGLLSICALAALIGGIALFFRHSAAAGWIGVVTAGVMIPLVLAFAYRIFPKTRFGQRTTLAPPKRQRGDAIADTPQLQKLLGAAGRVITPLRPVGTCDFGGQKVECVAESGYVERGKGVRVIRVEGTQLTVRMIEGA